MLGAIAGDIIGSVYEGRKIRTEDFELFCPASRFTDDTVLTVAVADCILNGKDYALTFKEYGRRYPDAGYGGFFRRWIFSESLAPYNSFGNGSAMRVSPVGFAFDSMETVLREAKRSAEVTHNHPEGIKGAQATAAAVFLLRTGESRDGMKKCMKTDFGFDLDWGLDDIPPLYSFESPCRGTVIQALTAFLESKDYEDTIRKAVYIGGDSDTIGCIGGGLAQACYKMIPEHIVKNARKLLPPELLSVVDQFNTKYGL